MGTRALTSGHQIHWYRIESVLAQGGFGATYLAHDTNLDRRVAIKEYLPTTVAARHADDSVRPLAESKREDFAWGLDNFLAEARTLARFRHENIVGVHSVFEANNTAYVVMAYEQGDSLVSLYRRGEYRDQRSLERVFFPIFDGLGEIHRLGFVHRDIKPANIYIREDGTAVLLDFGTARSIVQQQTGEMTSLVSQGYTPLEQYSVNYGEQGPWTDIYALAATMHEGITGRKPEEALSRSACLLRRRPDPVATLSTDAHPGFDARFLEAVSAGLALQPEERPADLYAWRVRFRGDSGSRTPAARFSESDTHDEPTHLRPRGARGEEKGDGDDRTLLRSPGPRPVPPVDAAFARRLGTPAGTAPHRTPSTDRGDDPFAAADDDWAGWSSEQAPAASPASPPPAASPSEDTSTGLLWHAVPPPPAHEPPRVDEDVQFTVYRPRIMAPGRWYRMLAFAHLGSLSKSSSSAHENPLKEVKHRAQALLGTKVDDYRSSTADSGAPIPTTGELCFVPEVPGFVFNPPVRRFYWLEEIHQEEFRMLAEPATGGRTAKGKMTVFMGNILVAEISLSIRIDSSVDTADAIEDTADTTYGYRKIFASYSHEDLTIVEEIERYASSIGDIYLRDWTELRAGERWSSRLRELIEEANVFQLFWSNNSRRSEFVRNEYQHAISLARPNFIRPTYWENPLPEPPLEMADLHFQRLPIRPMDRRSDSCGASSIDLTAESSVGPATPQTAEPKRASSMRGKPRAEPGTPLGMGVAALLIAAALLGGLIAGLDAVPRFLSAVRFVIQ